MKNKKKYIFVTLVAFPMLVAFSMLIFTDLWKRANESSKISINNTEIQNQEQNSSTSEIGDIKDSVQFSYSSFGSEKISCYVNDETERTPVAFSRITFPANSVIFGITNESDDAIVIDSVCLEVVDYELYDSYHSGLYKGNGGAANAVYYEATIGKELKEYPGELMETKMESNPKVASRQTLDQYQKISSRDTDKNAFIFYPQDDGIYTIKVVVDYHIGNRNYQLVSNKIRFVAIGVDDFSESIKKEKENNN